MKTKPRISDIAARSGVSPATVSLVLNDKPGVSQETRIRILEVAAELQYPVPNAYGSGSCPKLKTVGMLVKIDQDRPPQANPFYSKVILGIEEACRRSGINLLFATLPVDDRNCPGEIPALLNNGMADGLLFVGFYIDEALAAAAGRNNCPLVLVDGYTDHDRYDRAISDNFRGAYQAVEYLLFRGHRRIALAGGEPTGFPSLVERRNGYFRAMKENGGEKTFTANFNVNKTTGQEEIQTLLLQNPEITALFCLNDEIAASAARVAFEIGRKVPENLSIIGYDDTYLAAGAHPSLTTMRVDTLALGRAAVHLLSLRVENPNSALMTLTIHPSLVERESVATCSNNP